MSSEITFTSKLSANIAGIVVGSATSSKTQNANADALSVQHGTQLVGTAYEDLDLGDVLADANNTSMSYLVQLWNRDSDAVVQVKIVPDAQVNASDANISNVIPSCEIRPGEPWGPVRMKTLSSGYPKIQLSSNVENTQVEVTVAEAGDP